MQCPFCGHGKLHKHGRTRKGRQRFKCPKCQQTFTESFDTIYYRRQVSQQEVHTILQSHSEGSSLRGVSRISLRAYGTVASIIRQASQKAQMVHNQEVQTVETDAISADELWSFVEKNRNTARQRN
jgi:transposase-like protein